MAAALALRAAPSVPLLRYSLAWCLSFSEQPKLLLFVPLRRRDSLVSSAVVFSCHRGYARLRTRRVRCFVF